MFYINLQDFIEFHVIFKNRTVLNNVIYNFIYKCEGGGGGVSQQASASLTRPHHASPGLSSPQQASPSLARNEQASAGFARPQQASPNPHPTPTQSPPSPHPAQTQSPPSVHPKPTPTPHPSAAKETPPDSSDPQPRKLGSFHPQSRLHWRHSRMQKAVEGGQNNK